MRDGWIGIADAMPKQGQYCIVAADGIGQFLAVLWNGSEFIWADGAEYGAPAYDPLPSEKVTHWMKFPDDPTKIKEARGLFRITRRVNDE